ncbi:hypothetical protein VP01_1015g2 [Puccinia sorghi]|uniref:Uncharacterized protein n=1 Tax=Puccinia sorghi TaxID=27349 RepID=A0A0L6VVB9_9BASI|nr:hypothetical protein VP01_1015g2 [Puccinia sorghi]
MELMKETLGAAPLVVQLSGGVRQVELVTQEEVMSGRGEGAMHFCSAVRGQGWATSGSKTIFSGGKAAEGPAQAKSEATLARSVVVGVEWCPPVVGAEGWVFQYNEWVMFGGLDQMGVDFPKKSKGKGTARPSVPVPGKKKAAELAKRAVGGESQFALSLKELAVTVWKEKPSQ